MPSEAPKEKPLRFSKKQRLEKVWEFERTRTEGSRIVKGCLILNWRSGEGQAQPRLGVVTSKRIGNAVVRSRSRRLLREVFRVHQHLLTPSTDFVLVARQSIAAMEYAQVSRDFLAAAKQARILRQLP